MFSSTTLAKLGAVHELLGATNDADAPWRADLRAADRALSMVPRLGDPLISWMATSKARRALDRARALVDNADELHVTRLAYLDVAGVVPEAALSETEAIALEFQACRSRQGRVSRGWWLSSFAGSVVLLVLVVVIVLRPAPRFDPRKDPVGAAFSKALPRLVVLLDQRGPPGLQGEAALSRARQDILTEPVKTSLGADGSAHLEQLLNRVSEAARWAPSADAEASLASARVACDGVLAELGALDVALSKRMFPILLMQM
ncbi:MAG: hypothetical protein U0165_02750 [Polyangiaceae bacterium]